MALRAGYKGIKKVGSGLVLTTDGVLKSSGGPGGAIDLSDLDDVVIGSPLDGDLLIYDATTEKWYNEQPDDTVAEDSSKPVSGGAVFEAIAGLSDIVAIPDTAFTLNEGVSITSNWSCQMGKILNIGLQLEFTSASPSSTTVLTMSDYQLGNGKAGITGMSILATKVSPQAGMYVFDVPAGNGPIKVRNVQAVSQGEKVCITGTFIIK